MGARTTGQGYQMTMLPNRFDRRFLLSSLAGLTAAAALPFPAFSDDYPPTGGDMSGFILIKDRVPAPTVPFFLEDGTETDLRAFQGKVLIVNFWATWCAPCIKEMPSLDRLQAAFPGEDFEVVAVSQDRGGAKVAAPFLRDRLKLENLAVYLDPKFKLGRAFKNRGLPATYAIDRTGNLVGGLFGPAEWDSEDAKNLVRHLLDEKPNV